MRWRGYSPLKIELHFLQKKIVEGDFELEEMDYQWRRDNSPCCPACRFGYYYSELCDKQERRRVREKYLLKLLKTSKSP